MKTRRNKAAEDVLPCLVLPMCAEPMIVPSVTVAEVIDYLPPEPLPGAPVWFMGIIEWRSITVPVVSFERFNHFTDSRQGSNSKLAIMNVVSNQHYMRFFGLVIQGMPETIKLLPDSLQAQDDSMGDGVVMKVSMSGHMAFIPDMDIIERAILTCHQWSKRFNIQAQLAAAARDSED